MTHEEFTEKYAALLEREDFLEIQIQRGNGVLDDNSYLEKLMAFGVSREDALGYMEADGQLNALMEESGIFDDMEAVTLLMMNDMDNVEELKQEAANNAAVLRSQLISTNGLSDEEADKVITYLLKRK